MPDLTGKPLDEATSLAETFGLNVATVDGAESPLGGRHVPRGGPQGLGCIELERRRSVPGCREPLQESHMVLAVAKNGERAVNPPILGAMVLDRFTELASPDADARQAG